MIKFIQSIRFMSLSFLSLLIIGGTVSAAPVIRAAHGPNAAAIQATVDQFRADLGGANNGGGGSFLSGRREINWDGVPDSFAEPNFLPNDFFNVNSQRGLVYNAIEDRTATGDQTNDFLVSADSNNPTGTPVRFGSPFSSQFVTFSGERLFIARATHLTEVLFYIPGTRIPATVSGFGVVFTDIDAAVSHLRTVVRFFDANGKELTTVSPTPQSNGLSFIGASFNGGERIARVIIESGACDIGCSGTDGSDIDVVAMDDFIYGEPRALQYHPSDFDGDGTTDRVMFRPSTGQWFVLNSGSNTLSGTTFGQPGDVPIEGDFDGDSRSDFAIWRPSTGQWIVAKSSNANDFIFANLGTDGDKPVPGDYDKDGKTDPAVWRASDSSWFYLESKNNLNTFNVIGFGIPGDIPPMGSAQ